MISAAAARRSTTPSIPRPPCTRAGWRASDLPDLIEQYNLTSEEANRIYDELLQIEQSAQSKED